MVKYVSDLQSVHEFLKTHPTLTQQRVHFGKGRLSESDTPARVIANVINNAGMAFLDRIHEEIDDAQPQWIKDTKQKELDELAGKTDDDVTPYVPPPLVNEELPDETFYRYTDSANPEIALS